MFCFAFLYFCFTWWQNGVVFALSGLVNPERANIRETALQMGAQYRPDWTSDCTLLVCAFANTPKFNQVKNNNGTIVSKVFFCKRFLIYSTPNSLIF